MLGVHSFDFGKVRGFTQISLLVTSSGKAANSGENLSTNGALNICVK